MNRQKAKDLVLVVSLFGLWLLMPPVITFFDRPAAILGVPLIIVYVFGVWFALVAAAFVLSRQLPDDVPAAPGAATPAGDDGPR